MIRRPPISTRTDTLFPYTTLFRSVDEQSGGKLPSSIPQTRTRHAPVSTDEVATEIRLCPCQSPQPLQPGTPSRRSPDLSRTPPGRTGRVERRHGLTTSSSFYSWVPRRPVAIKLTAPAPRPGGKEGAGTR